MGHIAFVESNLSGTGYRLLARAKERGHRVTLVCRDPDYYGAGHGVSGSPLAPCDHVLRADTNDPEAVVAGLRRQCVDGVTSVGEYYLFAAAYAAERLRLPGPPAVGVATARDKAGLRQTMSGAGLPVPRHGVAGTVEEATRIAAEVGLPCVTKPVDRSSSVAVRRGDSLDEVAAQAAEVLALRHPRGLPTRRAVLVEELLDGPELSVETVAADGIMDVLAVVATTVTRGPHFVELEHWLPVELGARERLELVDLVRSTLRCCGLNHGMAHTEVRLTSGGPRVLEVNPRLAGGMIPELVRLATGVAPLDAVIDVALGRPVRVQRTMARAAGIRFLTSAADGVLSTIEGWPANVTDSQLWKSPGDPVRRPRSSEDRLGYVIVTGATGGQVRAQLDELAGAMRPRVEGARGGEQHGGGLDR